MLKFKKYLLAFAIICNALFSLAQPANDECTAAIDLGSNYFAYISAPAAFTNAGATASNIGSASQPACFNGQNDRDVWFQFTTDNTNLDLALIVRGVAGGLLQPQVAVYRDNCPMSSGDIEIFCTRAASGGNQTILQLGMLDPMTTYYIRVNDWANTGTSNAGAFGLTLHKNWLLNDDYTPTVAGSITDTVGIVMDSGGHGNPPTTSYTSADYYTMIINPAGAGCMLLTLDFLKIVGTATLKIYDGTVTTGVPIANLTTADSTSNAQRSFICPSGKATILFTAQPFGPSPAEGFVIDWRLVPNCASVSPCDALLFDNGGSTGNYTDNATVVQTFCPNIPNNKMVLNFSAIDILSGDMLCIFDGNSVAAPSLACLNNTVANPTIPISATSANTQGCLTLQFTSNATGNGAGYAAHLYCERLCQPILPVLETSTLAISPAHSPLIAPGDSAVNILAGTQVTISASATYPNNNTYYHQEDSTSTYTFDWGDGHYTTMIGNAHTASHTYGNRGIYFIKVKVGDSDGECTVESANRQRVRVLDFASSILTSASPGGCLNAPNQLLATFSTINRDTLSYHHTNSSFYERGAFCLPDDIASPTVLPITVFGSQNPTITATKGLKSVFSNFQHSYAGDLEIEIECPNGQKAKLKAYGANNGAGTFFGLPNDNDALSSCTENAQGFDYSWTNQSPQYNYTLPQLLGNLGPFCTPFNPYMNANPVTVCSGSYLPSEDISGAGSPLIGCPINGTWKLRFIDHISLDNGICYGYGLEFDRFSFSTPNEIYVLKIDSTQSGWHTAPDLAIQTPVYTPAAHTYPATATPTTIGTHNYVFTTKYFDFPAATDSIQIMANVPAVLSMLHDTTFCTGTVSFSAAQVAAACPIIQNYFAVSGLPIPDNTGVPLYSPIEVTGQTCNMTAGGIRQVRIDITHSKTSDLTIYLVSPTGAQILLTQNNGTGANYTNTCFSTYSANLPLISSSSMQNPFTGEFRPQDNLAGLFTGQPINGIWRLRINDNVSGNTGTLNNWSISFGPPDPNTYQWSDGSTTPTITVLPDVATTYSVTVTNVEGCSATGSAMAIPDSMGTLALRTTTTPDIHGAHNGTARVHTCGGAQRVLAYTYQWSNGQTTREITGLTVGVYTVTVTSPNGSTQSATAVVTEILAPIVSVISTAFAENISIQPNPTDGMLRLTANLVQNKPVWVEVRNVYGQLLQTENLAGSTKIDVLVDLSSYANGVYLLTLRNEEGQITLKTALNR